MDKEGFLVWANEQHWYCLKNTELSNFRETWEYVTPQGVLIYAEWYRGAMTLNNQMGRPDRII